MLVLCRVGVGVGTQEDDSEVAVVVPDEQKKTKWEVWRRYSEFEFLKSFFALVYPHVSTYFADILKSIQYVCFAEQFILMGQFNIKYYVRMSHYACLCIFTHTHARTHARTHTHTHTHTYTHTHAHTHMCTHRF